MRRAAYLLSLLDARDRLVGAGIVAALLLSAGGSFYVKGRHDERAAREARCTERVRQDEARWRAKGFQIVRAAMPCDSEGRR